MRSVTTLFALTFLFSLSTASPSSNNGASPPTTPASPSGQSLPSPPTECLAPPSQQAANRRYLRQVQIIECQNYHAAADAARAAAVAATTTGTNYATTTGTNYNAEEVDARQMGAVDDIVPSDAYPDMPQLAGMDTYEMLRPDPAYQDFLRGIEMAPTAAEGMRMPTIGAGAGGMGLPDGAWTLIVGAVILFARAAAGRSRRRPQRNEGDEAGLKVRLGEGR